MTDQHGIQQKCHALAESMRCAAQIACEIENEICAPPAPPSGPGGPQHRAGTDPHAYAGAADPAAPYREMPSGMSGSCTGETRNMYGYPAPESHPTGSGGAPMGHPYGPMGYVYAPSMGPMGTIGTMPSMSPMMPMHPMAQTYPMNPMVATVPISLTLLP